MVEHSSREFLAVQEANLTGGEINASLPSRSQAQRVVRRLLRRPTAFLSFLLLLGVVAYALLAPILCQQDPDQQQLNLVNHRPSSQFWFGTDYLGRDMFTRIAVGTRLSLALSISATLVVVVIGFCYGSISACTGGRVDLIMMRILEVLSGIPSLIILLLLMVYLGSGLISLLGALVLTGWTGTARLIRGQVLVLNRLPYVSAARLMGCSTWSIVLRHLLPNVAGLLLVRISFAIPSFIFGEAFLSFIGLGIQPPGTSLGLAINSGYANLRFFPHQTLFPSLVLGLLVIGSTLFGDALRDAIDPNLENQ